MREHKQSDSPSGYARDVYRRRVKPLMLHEQAVRERERRRVLALVAKPMSELEEDPEFPGCFW
jgi:hypothetical protein